jgi:hypothetical protein
MAIADQDREAAWRGLLGEWRTSGLSIYAFCKRRQLRTSTFYYWRDKLGFGTPRSAKPVLSSASASSTRFVPVTLVAEPMAEVAAHGVTLRLPLGASREQIAAWLGALAAVRPC